MDLAEVAVKCPECGIKFNTKQWPIIFDTGNRNSELRQDFKGIIPQFEPHTICTCPSCARADWMDTFPPTEEEAVLSQPSTTAHLQYRMAAIAAERSGKGSLTVGMFYLYAAWCADDAGAVPQAREYRRLAVDSFKRSLIDVSCPVDNRPEIEYLIGELLRRAGDFEGCQAHYKVVLSRLPANFALMARRIMRLAESGNTDAIEFSGEAA